MPVGSSLLAVACLLAHVSSGAAPAAAQAPPEPPPAPDELHEVAALDGLYPLWEHTGLTHASGNGQVGYRNAQWAFGRLQLGTQPFLDLYGTLNLQAKVALWRGRTTWAALSLGGYRLPTAAQERGLGQLHPTQFENPFAPVTLLPISLAGTWRPTARTRLHAATTVLIARSPDPAQAGVSAGQGLLAELLASRHWAARLHAGVEGLGVQPQAHVGVSFAYGLRWLQLQAGYARRLPLPGQAGDGVFMFDGAVLFR